MLTWLKAILWVEFTIPSNILNDTVALNTLDGHVDNPSMMIRPILMPPRVEPWPGDISTTEPDLDPSEVVPSRSPSSSASPPPQVPSPDEPQPGPSGVVPLGLLERPSSSSPPPLITATDTSSSSGEEIGDVDTVPGLRRDIEQILAAPYSSFSSSSSSEEPGQEPTVRRKRFPSRRPPKHRIYRVKIPTQADTAIPSQLTEQWNQYRRTIVVLGSETPRFDNACVKGLPRYLQDGWKVIRLPLLTVERHLRVTKEWDVDLYNMIERLGKKKGILRDIKIFSCLSANYMERHLGGFPEAELYQNIKTALDQYSRLKVGTVHDNKRRRKVEITFYNRRHEGHKIIWSSPTDAVTYYFRP